MPEGSDVAVEQRLGGSLLETQMTVLLQDGGQETSSQKPSTSHLMEHILTPPPPLEKKVPLSPDSSQESETGDIKYGELIVLGYNGSLLGGDHGRKKSKFVLSRREKNNGVKPARKYVVDAAKSVSSIGDKGQHSVYYTLNRSQTVVVDYEPDDQTDMFQIGRSSDEPIDCVVMDTVPGNLRKDGGNLTQSTISRFSCRLCFERKPPYTARIYAAGFDTERNIFLGEKACKWKTDGEVDGLTTNGILLLQPKSTVWAELSIGGGVFALRETRSVPGKSERLKGKSNVLYDGSLIDLCGATLLWRSSSGLQSAPSSTVLEEQIERINAGRPQCPVGLNTLVLPKKNKPPNYNEMARSTGSGLSSGDPHHQPYVYLKCGHVHGEHEWGRKGGAGASADSKRLCPMCLQEGPFVQVQVGTETSVYTDSSPLTHCFTPCAHMASEATVKHWSSVTIPYGCQGFRSICPFCATPLSAPNGHIKLVFQDNIG